MPAKLARIYFMTDISAETAHTIQGLSVTAHESSIKKKLSLKKKREEISSLLLKSQGIKHGEKCTRCNVNCEVKHREDITFWAVREGIAPIYTLETCPRQGKLEKLKVKRHKR